MLPSIWALGPTESGSATHKPDDASYSISMAPNNMRVEFAQFPRNIYRSTKNTHSCAFVRACVYCHIKRSLTDTHPVIAPCIEHKRGDVRNATRYRYIGISAAARIFFDMRNVDTRPPVFAPPLFTISSLVTPAPRNEGNDHK